ncbi:MAG: hypothetical protein Q4G22_11920 [Paracoccus sp. (in: a-proteobacteria)]|uniref:hypothetical protein n=1 Tax=Paracoccus sp. TaxID=267 RepID=UPI0026E06C02|nr:hypothetical protein [Paracoccus sp. (in: a-proteobacteria)]MDO5632529.1 hypothetical protein [Paracoccus sp. (in: a-proteobacteria)]
MDRVKMRRGFISFGEKDFAWNFAIGLYRCVQLLFFPRLSSLRAFTKDDRKKDVKGNQMIFFSFQESCRELVGIDLGLGRIAVSGWAGLAVATNVAQ